MLGMARGTRLAALQALGQKGRGSSWDSQCPACTVRGHASRTQPLARPGRLSFVCRRFLLSFKVALRMHMSMWNGPI